MDLMALSDVDREILRILLKELVAPAMASLPPMDEHVAALKKDVAQLLRDHGAPVETVARHLGMSVRWVRSMTNTDQTESGGSGWFLVIMTILASHHPDALDAATVAEETKPWGRGLSVHATATLLELYCRLGHVVQVEGGYRAHSSVIVGAEPAATERIEKLRTRVRDVWPISRSFVRGDVGSAFGHFVGEVDPESLESMTAELVSAVSAIVGKYVQKAEEKPGSDRTRFVTFNGILAVGHKRPGESG